MRDYGYDASLFIQNVNGPAGPLSSSTLFISATYLSISASIPEASDNDDELEYLFIVSCDSILNRFRGGWTAPPAVAEVALADVLEDEDWLD